LSQPRQHCGPSLPSHPTEVASSPAIAQNVRFTYTDCEGLFTQTSRGTYTDLEGFEGFAEGFFSVWRGVIWNLLSGQNDPVTYWKAGSEKQLWEIHEEQEEQEDTGLCHAGR